MIIFAGACSRSTRRIVCRTKRRNLGFTVNGPASSHLLGFLKRGKISNGGKAASRPIQVQKGVLPGWHQLASARASRVPLSGFACRIDYLGLVHVGCISLLGIYEPCWRVHRCCSPILWAIHERYALKNGFPGIRRTGSCISYSYHSI